MQIACNYKGYSILQGGTKTAFLDFASPEASHECSWARSRCSLETLGRSWDVPGGPQRRPGAFLGSLLDGFAALLSDLRAPEGPQDAPGTEVGPTLD